MNFKLGFDFEDRICTKLDSIGCKLQRDQRLDHKYKLDFKVIAFPDNPGTYSLGVQLTTKRDDYEKQQEFEASQRNTNVAQKALYLELNSNLDLEDGGALAVLNVIAGFQFDRRFSDVKVEGAVIHPDYTYEYFDLTQRSNQIRENARLNMAEQNRPMPASPLQMEQLAARFGNGAAPAPVPAPPPVPAANEVSAMLTAYKRAEGFGFATANGGEVYFVHVNAVVDDRLREQLQYIPYSETPYSVEIPVAFVDGGLSKPGAKYKAARNIRYRSA
jgi:hypothetical protein